MPTTGGKFEISKILSLNEYVAIVWKKPHGNIAVHRIRRSQVVKKVWILA